MNFLSRDLIIAQRYIEKSWVFFIIILFNFSICKKEKKNIKYSEIKRHYWKFHDIFLFVVFARHLTIDFKFLSFLLLCLFFFSIFLENQTVSALFWFDLMRERYSGQCAVFHDDFFRHLQTLTDTYRHLQTPTDTHHPYK